MSEGKRIRWGNVIRALVAGAAISVVVAWPRLASPAPSVPDGVPVPAVSPAADGDETVRRSELRGEQPRRSAARPSAGRARHRRTARVRSEDRSRRLPTRRRGSRRPVRAPAPTARPPARSMAAPAPAPAPATPAAPASAEFQFER